MFTRIPPLHLLVAFEAAARHASFARAAEELSVTPSAVSHRIKNLEELWGEDLFVRTNTALRLTTAGARMLCSVQEALGALNTLARPAFNRQRTRLRIASPPTFGRQHLVWRLGEFTSLYPHIDIEIHTTIPFVDVTAEEVDVEIRFGTGQYADLKATPILTEPCFPACGRAYYERINGRDIHQPQDLQHLTLLRSPLEPWKPWFDAAGLDWGEPSTGLQFNDIGMLMVAIQSNQGVGLVRQRLAQTWLASGEIVRLLDLEAQPMYAFYLVEKQHGPLKPEVRQFCDWLLGLQW